MEKSDEPEGLRELRLRITKIITTPVANELEATILGNVYLNLLRVEKDLSERRKLIDKFHELRLRFPDSKELNELSEKFPSE